MSLVDTRARMRASASSASADPDQMMGCRAVAQRYNISLRSVDYWLQRPGLAFPRPAMLIGIRRYWRLADLIEWERAQAVRAAAKRKGKSNQGGPA